MFIYEGQVLNLLAPLVLGEIQYPANWFLDTEARLEVGIVEVPEPVAPPVADGQEAVLTGFKQSEAGEWLPAWDVRQLPLPPGVSEEECEQFMQSILDAKARERRYDGIISLCTYATSTISKFAAEGQAGVKWRDEFWAFGYDLMAKVKSGEVPAPTLPELAAMLPQLEWPE
jgi:hypothetical protein